MVLCVVGASYSKSLCCLQQSLREDNDVPVVYLLFLALAAVLGVDFAHGHSISMK
jgi:energy-converting hydrogenase Eha subunit F